MFGKPHLKPYEGKFRAVVVFGPPGSGKGTLGAALACAAEMFHLSSGDIFRGLDGDARDLAPLRP
ncbi:MAG: nucleoside monophosphate kinase [Parachlamydiales bacterium]